MWHHLLNQKVHIFVVFPKRPQTGIWHPDVPNRPYTSTSGNQLLTVRKPAGIIFCLSKLVAKRTLIWYKNVKKYLPKQVPNRTLICSKNVKKYRPKKVPNRTLICSKNVKKMATKTGS
jgi:hypothetical protein